MKTMTHQQRWDRAVAVTARIRQIVAEIDQLPKVPITIFLNAEMRRQYRRFAARLRAGKIEPRYKNLFTAEQLADICEQACKRDEFLEKALKELHELSDELRAMIEENDAELARGATPSVLHLKDAAEWLGPDSEAEHAYREAQRIRRQGQRRRNGPLKPQAERIPLPGADYELHLRHWLAAAELLPGGAPVDEVVKCFPDVAAEDGDRIVLRIGIGEHSWVGSFQRGLTDYTTVQLMPGNPHLLVVANGAGYIVELVTNALVAEVGRDIASVVCDEAFPFLLLDHGGKSLEAFGAEGKMWSTDAVACGGFRDFDINDGVLSFEACQADGNWVEMGVDVNASRAAP
ncbi:MAG TPA: hypothetical protein VGR95_18450 [Thermoanaerobaculia bacterium]|nr:hypothetical protein [Thermoanaerobaculia bacterium]